MNKLVCWTKSVSLFFSDWKICGIKLTEKAPVINLCNIYWWIWQLLFLVKMEWSSYLKWGWKPGTLMQWSQVVFWVIQYRKLSLCSSCFACVVLVFLSLLFLSYVFNGHFHSFYFTVIYFLIIFHLFKTRAISMNLSLFHQGASKLRSACYVL